MGVGRKRWMQSGICSSLARIAKLVKAKEARMRAKMEKMTLKATTKTVRAKEALTTPRRPRGTSPAPMLSRERRNF